MDTVLLTTERDAELIFITGFDYQLATNIEACVMKDHTEDVMAVAPNTLHNTLERFFTRRSFRWRIYVVHCDQE